jgi:hypothetical protein
MEWLYFIIFGGLLYVFIGYFIKLHREDKRILKQLEDEEKKRQSELQAKADGRVLGWRDLSEEEVFVFYSELPSLDCYKSLN